MDSRLQLLFLIHVYVCRLVGLRMEAVEDFVLVVSWMVSERKSGCGISDDTAASRARTIADCAQLA